MDPKFVPNDVHRTIFNKCGFGTQIKWRLVNNRFNRRLHIVNFYNTSLRGRFNDTILKKYRYVMFLSAGNFNNKSETNISVGFTNKLSITISQDGGMMAYLIKLNSSAAFNTNFSCQFTVVTI